MPQAIAANPSQVRADRVDLRRLLIRPDASFSVPRAHRGGRFSGGDMAERRQVLTGGAIALGGLAWPRRTAWAATAGEISRAAESIHQEPTFTVSRKHVYEALTDAGQFDRVTQASGVMNELSQMTQPTRISPNEGGRFVLFG